MQYVHPFAPPEYLLFCLKGMLFSASGDHVKVMRDGRVENFSFTQRENVDGEVVEEGVGDEEVNRIAVLLGCDQLFIPDLMAKRA